MPIFLTTAVVLWRSAAVLNCSRDMASLHHLLNVMPNDIPIQALIDDAQDLFRLLFTPSIIVTYVLVIGSFSTLAQGFFKCSVLRMFPPSLLRGPLMEDYQHLLRINRVKRPPLPKTSLRAWLLAGTATAAIYVLSRYMFVSVSC